MVVYKIMNLANGKVYVGQTVRTVAQRWRAHVWDAANKNRHVCPYFYRAIRKYGPEQFIADVLEKCPDRESMDKAEKAWIERLDARNPLKGYNIDFGGRSAGGLSPEGRERQQRARVGRVCSPETREKLRQAHLGKRLTGECREKIRKAITEQMRNPSRREAVARANRGNTRHLGKTLSDGSRAKIRKLAVERYRDPVRREAVRNAYKGRPVRCLETGEVFKSQCTAARCLGVGQGNINAVLTGRSRHAKGYTFAYAERG